MQTFAQALKAKMEEKRLSQDELAEAVGVSQNTISKYTRGEVDDPGVSVVIKIAKALKVPVSYFYPDIGDVMPMQGGVSNGTRVIDHLITENENLWEETKKSSTKELKMLDMLQHFILKKGAGAESAG